MRTFIIIALLSITALAQAQEPQCTELLQLEREYAKKLPLQIDEATTLVELSVNCTTKIVKYVKHLSVSGDMLAAGFRDRKQRQYLNLHCNKQGLAASGWTARDYIYDKNMQLLMKMEATPGMCNER